MDFLPWYPWGQQPKAPSVPGAPLRLQRCRACPALPGTHGHHTPAAARSFSLQKAGTLLKWNERLRTSGNRFGKPLLPGKESRRRRGVAAAERALLGTRGIRAPRPRGLCRGARPPGSPPVLNFNPLVSEAGCERRACPVWCEPQLLRGRLTREPRRGEPGTGWGWALALRSRQGQEYWLGREIPAAAHLPTLLWNSFSALSFGLEVQNSEIIFLSGHSVESGTQPLYGRPCLANTLLVCWNMQPRDISIYSQFGVIRYLTMHLDAGDLGLGVFFCWGLFSQT